MVIGSSTQQLLLQLPFLLKNNFLSIFLENPGYNGARDVFRMQQFQIEPLPVTEQGFDLHELHERTRLAYVTPSHHFPYGVSMPIRERQLLLNWATKVEGYIIEDDYDSEFRYIQQPYPALASLDSRRVIYTGTFSKAFLPAISLSYMVLPEALMTEYKKYFSTIENTASVIHQQTMASFMEAGDWDRHIRRMRILYKRKMHFLVSTLNNIFNTKITIIGEQSGLYVLIRIYTNTPENILIKKALGVGVKVYPTSSYFIKDIPNEPILQLGFGNLTYKEIKDRIILLENTWQL